MTCQNTLPQVSLFWHTLTWDGIELIRKSQPAFKNQSQGSTTRQHSASTALRLVSVVTVQLRVNERGLPCHQNAELSRKVWQEAVVLAKSLRNCQAVGYLKQAMRFGRLFCCLCTVQTYNCMNHDIDKLHVQCTENNRSVLFKTPIEHKSLKLLKKKTLVDAECLKIGLVLKLNSKLIK